MDYNSMLKAELIEECKRRDISYKGTKAVIIKALESDDKSAKEISPKEQKPVPVRVFNSMLHRYEYK